MQDANDDHVCQRCGTKGKLMLFPDGSVRVLHGPSDLTIRAIRVWCELNSRQESFNIPDELS